MRRPLARATAACTASALALSLWAAVPAADKETPAEVEGTTLAEKRGNSAGHTGEHAKNLPSTPAHSDRTRTQAETSHWTYIDRAFPEQAYDGAETTSVGIGRLEWDRVYTRRALLRFPVELDPEAVVDSAVLRTGVSWSYDCHSRSHVQLHRVDPFGTGTTWNDQPTAQALLDTRSIQGGKGTCPDEDGVEFDATQAYQRAVDNGESHLHLRLKERDESGTTAWHRFRVADTPPVLVVDHTTPHTGATPLEAPASRHDTVLGKDAPEPPPPVPAGEFTFCDGNKTVVTRTGVVSGPIAAPGSGPRNETGRARLEEQGAIDLSGTAKNRYRRNKNGTRRPRGPPGRTTVGGAHSGATHRPQENRLTDDGPSIP